MRTAFQSISIPFKFISNILWIALPVNFCAYVTQRNPVTSDFKLYELYLSNNKQYVSNYYFDFVSLEQKAAVKGEKIFTFVVEFLFISLIVIDS